MNSKATTQRHLEAVDGVQKLRSKNCCASEASASTIYPSYTD